MEIINSFINSTSGETRRLLIELQEYKGLVSEAELLDLIKDIVEGNITDISFLTSSIGIDE